MIEIKRNKQPAAKKPVEAIEAQAEGKSTPNTESTLKREIKPFTGIDAKRDYRAMYRAVFEFHNQHNPPQTDKAYWQQNKPGEADPPQADLDYWAKAAADVAAVSKQFGNDKFIMDLLCAVYDELGREYEAARRQACPL